MVFHVVAVGRLGNADLQSACDEYIKRIRRYAKFSIRELPGSRASRDEYVVLQAEGAQILDAVKRIPYRVLLTRQARPISSRQFSEKIRKWRERAQDTALIIGGAFGTTAEIQEACGEQLSLSAMTLPHELARLVLLEQLYRGFSILNGDPYHKGD